jgi:hypothetical protein
MTNSNNLRPHIILGVITLILVLALLVLLLIPRPPRIQQQFQPSSSTGQITQQIS